MEGIYPDNHRGSAVAHADFEFLNHEGREEHEGNHFYRNLLIFSFVLFASFVIYQSNSSPACFPSIWTSEHLNARLEN